MHVDDRILFEDNHIIAVNKPAGMLVQGDATGDLPIGEHVKQYLKVKYNKPGNVFIGVPHRLDRPVSGVVLLAKTSKALTRLTKMFRDSEVNKYYWALTNTEPKAYQKRLEHFLIKDEKRNIVKAYEKPTEGAKKAILEYELIRSLNGIHLINVKLFTGRPHQIRVQLSSINCPIIGDLKYGATTPNADQSICLHAREVDFIHPVSKEKISITAPLPSLDVWNAFSK